MFSAKARQKAFGEKDVVSNVPGAELLLLNKGSSIHSGSDDKGAAEVDILDVSNESNGNIVHVIVTTNAIITGLIVIETKMFTIMVLIVNFHMEI